MMKMMKIGNELLLYYCNLEQLLIFGWFNIIHFYMSCESVL